ncbi:Eukaryotic translation initiation factor 2A [Clonorchis sinensis]|uniref:Eukaryotic translation initiation factor 2A n=1 Tax=Clonorchis sinensis TaxID=79923 RepID=A0A8T1LYB7_CLOSI|nr:Eukaryotic translation initiation factor 2A [Clonorchis sinensis]
MFACFGSDGLRVFRFEGKEESSLVQSLLSNSLKNFSLAKNAKRVALSDGEKVTVLNTELDPCSEIPIKDVSKVVLSPCGSVLFTYQPYKTSAEQPNGAPNVRVFDVDTGDLLKEYIHRSTGGWQPQWTNDSAYCAVRVDGDVQLYSKGQFGSKPTGRLAVKGMCHFSLSTSSVVPSVAVYVPCQKGQPSSVRIFQWQSGQFQLTTSKSFYRADTVQLYWNDRGTDLLTLSSTKTSEESYYGDQGLFYLTTKRSSDSAVVTMPRKGPIYDVAWRPDQSARTQNETRSTEQLFAVCHGFVPASVTVFGTDCEPRFNLGTGSWNQIHFNPHGNLLLLAGLGNLPGDMCIWDFGRQERLSTFKTTDITSVTWMNDGEHLLMATTTPRLRVNNGFGIWHYSGKKLFFQRVEPRAVPRPATMDLPAATDHELYQVVVMPQDHLPPAPRPKKFDPVLQVSNGTGTASKGGKYIPPALRNRSEVAKQAVAAAHALDSVKGQYQPPAARPNLPVGMDPNMLDTKKPKKRKKPATEKSESVASGEPHPTPNPPGMGNKQASQLRKKLNEIEKLKAERAAGKQLAFNQIEKIDREEQIRAELAKLTLSG